MNYYDDDTLKEYNRLHRQVIKDMPKYIRGELKDNDLNKFKKLSSELNNIQKEMDFQYMSRKHHNDNKFWDEWSRIHN